MKAAAEKMVQKGEMTQEQAEELLTRIEEFNQRITTRIV
jgi:polyhydroxyalkanoate synthesis regulator phasin